MKSLYWIMPLSALFFWFGWVQATPETELDNVSTAPVRNLDDLIVKYHSGHFTQHRMAVAINGDYQETQDLISLLHSNRQLLVNLKNRTQTENQQAHRIIEQLINQIENGLEQLDEAKICDQKDSLGKKE
jgi:hypothetical protein